MANPMTQINVRVTPDLYERLSLTQANTGRTQSEIVRLLLEKHLDRKPRITVRGDTK